MMIEKLLQEEIKSGFDDLKRMKLGSDEHKSSVDELTKLVDRAIELEKVEIDAQDKIEERDLKLKQLEEDKKDRLWRNIMTGAGIVIPSAVTIWGTVKSIDFEKEGTITTIMGRGFIQKLLPKK